MSVSCTTTTPAVTADSSVHTPRAAGVSSTASNITSAVADDESEEEEADDATTRSSAIGSARWSLEQVAAAPTNLKGHHQRCGSAGPFSVGVNSFSGVENVNAALRSTAIGSLPNGNRASSVVSDDEDELSSLASLAAVVVNANAAVSAANGGRVTSTATAAAVAAALAGTSSTTPTSICLQGSLFKWTNYLHGWQPRYFVLAANHTLSYYKSENDSNFGCRGAVSIQKAICKPHEFDECRFDIGVVNGDMWYLRAKDVATRNRWLEAIETHRNPDSAYGSDQSLRRHGSSVSIGSTLSAGSFGSRRSLIREKVSEIRTFKDLLLNQMDSIQSLYDRLTAGSASESTVRNMNSVDVRGEAMTFRATSEALLATCIQCVELVSQHDDIWRRKLEREVERRRRAEATLAAIVNGADAGAYSCVSSAASGTVSGGVGDGSWLPELCTETPQTRGVHHEDTQKRSPVVAILGSGGQLVPADGVAGLSPSRGTLSSASACSGPPSVAKRTAQLMTTMNCPDLVEGPHSLLNEEDFFDAVEAFIEQNDQEVEQKRQIRNKVRELQSGPNGKTAVARGREHPLFKEIDDTTTEQYRYALMGLGGEGGWQLFAEDGLMKMYKRELEVDGLVCDPLKAVHVVKGVTAHEVCHYFFAPEVRYDWEPTVESMKVVEVVEAGTTLVFHQIHKRVWPAAQRDALFWSHIEQMSGSGAAKQRLPSPSHGVDPPLGPRISGDLVNTWMVCNKSCDQPEIPAGRCLRVFLTVCLVGQTYVEGDPQMATREKLTTRITYCSSINPGGWAPASVLRSIYKREYPKFLKRFTQYVKEQTENKPIMF